MNTASHIQQFLFNLRFPPLLPGGVEVMHPFDNPETRRICSEFYKTFYADDDRRHFIIGINPGRFGGGVTGIPFTDPIRLQSACGIANNWPPRQELSSVFVYEMIAAFGGPQAFYKRFYFTSVSPLGFTKNGKNLNYYDDRHLAQSITPFAAECMQHQLAWGHNQIAFCLGEGANFKFVRQFNQQFGFFKEIIPLAHPRFVMQYRLKSKQEYIDKYLQALAQA